MNLSRIIKSSVFLFSLIVLTACASAREGMVDNSAASSGNIVVTSGQDHDWGDINIMGGKVEHNFQLKNDSNESLYLKGAQTSCMCTSTKFKFNDGTISPLYGMHNNSESWTKEIKPNETFEVEAVFDPMAHGPNSTGAIRRNISLFTSDSDTPVTKLNVSAMVLSEDDFMSLDNVPL